MHAQEIFTVRDSVASIIVMDAQCHAIDDFCNIVPNEQVFHFGMSRL